MTRVATKNLNKVISRAIAIIEREMAKNPASFAQVDASNTQSLVSALSAIVDAASFPGADNKKLVAFVQAQQGAEDEELGQRSERDR